MTAHSTVVNTANAAIAVTRTHQKRQGIQRRTTKGTKTNAPKNTTTICSPCAHSGSVAAILAARSARARRLPTGAMFTAERVHRTAARLANVVIGDGGTGAGRRREQRRSISLRSFIRGTRGPRRPMAVVGRRIVFRLEDHDRRVSSASIIVPDASAPNLTLR